MATTKAAKPVRTRTKVTTIEITPQQVIGFLNRMTSALEKVEQIGSVPVIGRDRVTEDAVGSFHASMGSMLCQPPACSPEPSLDSMTFELRDFIQSMAKHSSEIRGRLYGGSAPDTCAGPANTLSRGILKDNLSQSRGLLSQIQDDLYAISNYMNS